MRLNPVLSYVHLNQNLLTMRAILSLVVLISIEADFRREN